MCVVPVDIAKVVEILQTLHHVSDDDGYHLLFEAIAERLGRVHDVSTGT